MTANTTRRQLVRYALVGLVSNALLYLAYLALTRLGIEPKLAMTLSFVAGVTYTFLMNGRWTFAHRGNKRHAYTRYWIIYGVAYILNLALLSLFVDVLGYKHQFVQGTLVCGIAVLLFLLQKFWVFRETASDVNAGPHPMPRQ